MHDAALVFDIWEYFARGLQHPHALVADDELHAVQAAPAKPLKKADLTCLVLFHSLGSTQDLTETVLIHGNCRRNGDIFVFSAPVAAQGDAGYVETYGYRPPCSGRFRQSSMWT